MTYQLLAVLLIAAGAFLFGRYFDRDKGGYRDGFFTTAQFPDKVVHFLLGALLFMTLAHHMEMPLAMIGVFLIGLVYEIGQGYVSVFDWAADIAGAALAYFYLTFL